MDLVECYSLALVHCGGLVGQSVGDKTVQLSLETRLRFSPVSWRPQLSSGRPLPLIFSKGTFFGGESSRSLSLRGSDFWVSVSLTFEFLRVFKTWLFGFVGLLVGRHPLMWVVERCKAWLSWHPRNLACLKLVNVWRAQPLEKVKFWWSCCKMQLWMPTCNVLSSIAKRPAGGDWRFLCPASISRQAAGKVMLLSGESCSAIGSFKKQPPSMSTAVFFWSWACRQLVDVQSFKQVHTFCSSGPTS